MEKNKIFRITIQIQIKGFEASMDALRKTINQLSVGSFKCDKNADKKTVVFWKHCTQKELDTIVKDIAKLGFTCDIETN